MPFNCCTVAHVFAIFSTESNNDYDDIVAMTSRTKGEIDDTCDTP